MKNDKFDRAAMSFLRQVRGTNPSWDQAAAVCGLVIADWTMMGRT